MRKLTREEVEKLFKGAKVLEEPKIQQPIQKSCGNCADYIVCWQYEKIEEYDDEELNEKMNIERAKDCSDWHLDFLTYQKMIEEEK